jgi:hypothetical protein
MIGEGRTNESAWLSGAARDAHGRCELSAGDSLTAGGKDHPLVLEHVGDHRLVRDAAVAEHLAAIYSGRHCK